MALCLVLWLWIQDMNFYGNLLVFMNLKNRNQVKDYIMIKETKNQFDQDNKIGCYLDRKFTSIDNS